MYSNWPANLLVVLITGITVALTVLVRYEGRDGPADGALLDTLRCWRWVELVTTTAMHRPRR